MSPDNSKSRAFFVRQWKAMLAGLFAAVTIVAYVEIRVASVRPTAKERGRVLEAQLAAKWRQIEMANKDIRDVNEQMANRYLNAEERAACMRKAETAAALVEFEKREADEIFAEIHGLGR